MNLPNEKQISYVRKYFVEYTVVMLVVAVVYLFCKYNALQQFVTNELLSHTVKMEQIIERNTDALNFQNNNR